MNPLNATRKIRACEGEAAAQLVLEAFALEAVAAETRRCAAIADDEARIREEAGKKHPEESAARDRCFAGARAAANVARGIRSGEEVAPR
jgi:hypothetical protein